MSKHRSIHHTEFPIGYIPLPEKNTADYNKQMKSATNRFNNWVRYIARKAN